MDRAALPIESPDRSEQAFLVSMNQNSGVAKLGLTIDFVHWGAESSRPWRRSAQPAVEIAGVDADAAGFFGHFALLAQQLPLGVARDQGAVHRAAGAVEHQFLAAEGVQRQQGLLRGRQQRGGGEQRHLVDLLAVGAAEAAEGQQEGHGEQQVLVVGQAEQGEDAGSGKQEVAVEFHFVSIQ